MFLEIGVSKMLATETAIFGNKYFQRTPFTGCYHTLLKRFDLEPLMFDNIANYYDEFTKRRTIKDI